MLPFHLPVRLWIGSVVHIVACNDVLGLIPFGCPVPISHRKLTDIYRSYVHTTKGVASGRVVL